MTEEKIKNSSTHPDKIGATKSSHRISRGNQSKLNNFNRKEEHNSINQANTSEVRKIIKPKTLRPNTNKAPIKSIQSRANESTLVQKNTLKNLNLNKPNINSRPATIKNRLHKPHNSIQKPSIKVAFLGGLNEIGKNITIFECEDDMVILDCGMAFPDGEMLGVDLVIPDFSYIEKNIEKIKGIVLTHGHEDHIGALPYLLKNTNIPIYGGALTVGLLNGKLKEHNLARKAKLNVVKPGSNIKLGCMQIEFLHINHSIPDAMGVAIHSPAGTIVHTGDFKIDFTPTMTGPIDLARFGELGKNGVLALFADSTNAERPGYTMTEQKVKASFEILFEQAKTSRIIIASFASNISRIQQIIDCAVAHERKVAFSGRSMLNYIGIATELGYLKVPQGAVIELDVINKFPKEKTVLITTGSQGEPMSALSRMACADHRQISVGPGDFVIISAHPIPGNEKMVGAVINSLMKKGCKVVYESMYEVHVSGHACQEELKIIQNLVKPKYFIPVHGEQRHLRRHAALAKDMGLKESEIFVGEIGDLLEINQNAMKHIGKVPAGRVLVDGLGIGDVGNIVLRDRKHLAQDGLLVVVCTMDFSNGCIISGPDLVSRGFVYVKEAETLMENARNVATKVLEESTQDGIREWGPLKAKLRETLSRFFYEKTKRSPMILPIIMEI